MTSGTHSLCLNIEIEIETGMLGRGVGSEVGEGFAGLLTKGLWAQKDLPYILPGSQRKDCLTWVILGESYQTKELENREGIAFLFVMEFAVNHRVSEMRRGWLPTLAASALCKS